MKRDHSVFFEIASKYCISDSFVDYDDYDRKRSMSRLYIVTLLNLYAEYFMRNAGLEEAQARIKIAGRNVNNLRYADNTTLTTENEEELKSLLMKVKALVTQSCLTLCHPLVTSLPDPLEKGMVTHSNILAWRISCTEEPGGLQSMELQRVRYD